MSCNIPITIWFPESKRTDKNKHKKPSWSATLKCGYTKEGQKHPFSHFILLFFFLKQGLNTCFYRSEYLKILIPPHERLSYHLLIMLISTFLGQFPSSWLNLVLIFPCFNFNFNRKQIFCLETVILIENRNFYIATEIYET